MGQIDVDTTTMSVVVCNPLPRLLAGQSVTLSGQSKTVTNRVEKAVDVEIVGQIFSTMTLVVT